MRALRRDLPRAVPADDAVEPRLAADVVPDEPPTPSRPRPSRAGSYLAPRRDTGRSAEGCRAQVVADVPELACFRLEVDVTATAPAAEPRRTPPIVAGTSASDYGSLYYLVVGIGPRGIGGEPAIYAMRILGGLLASLFLAATVLAPPVHRHRWPFIAAGTTIAPMVFYLSGSVDPNAVEAVTARRVHEPRPRPGQRPGPGPVPLRHRRRGVAAASRPTRALSLLSLTLAVIAALLMFPLRDLLLLARNSWYWP